MARRHKNIKGFSLVEISIVMAIIGIMIGGLWTIFGQTSESTNQNQLAQDITAVVSNVRATYANRIAISGTTQTIMFNPSTVSPPGLVTLRTIFPGDMGAPGSKPSAPWGSASLGGGAFSTFNVCMWNTACTSPALCSCPLDNLTNAGASSPLFAIDVQNLSAASCMVAATRDSNSSMPAGLVDVYVNGTSVGLGVGAMPVRAPAAEAACNGNGHNASCAASSTGNCVDFVYRLNPAMTP